MNYLTDLLKKVWKGITMLEFKDDGTFVELSYYVPAYHPKALPHEALRTNSNLSYDKFIEEAHAYEKVYGNCPVVSYDVIFDDKMYNKKRKGDRPFNNSFSSIVYSLLSISGDDLFFSKYVNVLKAYFKLIKPLPYQTKPQKNSKPKRKYRKRTGVPRGIRNEVFKRDNYTCVQCGAKKGDKKSDGTIVSIEIDHVKPLAKGGTDEMSNLQTLCKDCNRNKNDVYQKVR